MKNRNKVSLKNVKQGRTFYILDQGLVNIPCDPHLVKYMVHSDNTDLPPLGCIVSEPPCWFVKKRFDKIKGGLYFSRRKAEKALADLKAEYTKMDWL